MITCNALAHVAIETHDLEKTELFYCGVLRLKKQFSFLKNGKQVGFYIKVSDRSFLEVFQTENMPAGKSALTHYCFETDNIEQAHNYLCSVGISTSEINKGCDSTLQFWFEDPNGIAMEFHQYTYESSQLTGKSVEIDW